MLIKQKQTPDVYRRSEQGLKTRNGQERMAARGGSPKSQVLSDWLEARDEGE